MTFLELIVTLTIVSAISLAILSFATYHELGGKDESRLHPKNLDNVHRRRDRSVETNASRPYLKE